MSTQPAGHVLTQPTQFGERADHEMIVAFLADGRVVTRTREHKDGPWLPPVFWQRTSLED